MTGFYKSFCPFFAKSLHIHFNPSQNVSPVLLLNGLMIVTNEGSIAYKCFKKGNVGKGGGGGGCSYTNIAYFIHIAYLISFIFTCHIKSLKFNL